MLFICSSTIGIFCRTSKALFSCLALISLLGIVLSAFQSAIQFGFLSDFCAVKKIDNIADFKNILENSPIPCSVIHWSFFGVPISLLNLMMFCLVFINSQIFSFRSKRPN
jgi:hypothetical protein